MVPAQETLALRGADDTYGLMPEDDPAPEATDAAQAPGTGLPPISPDNVEQELGTGIDNVMPRKGYQMLPVVGLGGSAGSIPALQKFFSMVPPDCGMAFVVILHLAPESESLLPEMLAKSTMMRVVHASDHAKVEPNTVYVIPPGALVSTTDGHLKLTPLQPERGRRTAVDLFFRTLADTHGPHATAIVLSGADGDGALGIKRIKERGGLTVVQDPEQAEHPSMPRSSIETGMVDWVLPVEQMPARLLEYRANGRRVQLPDEEPPGATPASPRNAADDEAALHEILSFLRGQTGRDYSYYKRATVLRRIARRMQVNAVATLPEYIGYMRTHPGEAGALQQDLLISVTNFFRDREAFASLQAEIPALFLGKSSGDAVRVWVAGCATGEEAYSIAILLLEYAERLDSPPVLQVFATDLAEEVIATAREALYPLTITADVSEERLRHFFQKEHGGYRARRELRETVLFAVHDLLKDPAFSRMDLVSCRNLLIYLTPEAQDRVLQIAHFALRPEGRLFLGTSETVDEESPLFVPIDKKQRLYRQHPIAKRPMPVPIGPSTVGKVVEAQERTRTTGPVIPGRAFIRLAEKADERELVEHEGRRVSWAELHFKLIERFAPPSVIVTRDYDLVHVSENAGRFLHFRSGEPTVNLLDLVNPMLRVELRAALFRAAQSNLPVEVFRVPAEVDGKTVSVDIRVSPAQEIALDYLLVVFSVREKTESEAVQARAEAEPVVRHLERELEQMKRRLRDTIEQYEASSEELKASNEELQAMNEELRSSAEELETSREELQSVNEELATVNQELKSKVDDLAHSNEDLANLMAATGVATIFLDRGLRITRYTPTAVTLFRLIPTDLGRPLTDLTHCLNYPELTQDAERVLRTLIPERREVCDGERWYLAHLLPYRTGEDRIAGVVLSFVDITVERRATHSLLASEERLRLILESATDYAIFTLDLNRRVTSWHAGAQKLFSYTEAEMLGQSGDVLFVPEDRSAGAPEEEAHIAQEKGRAGNERWHLRRDGSRFYGSGISMPLRRSKEIVGYVKIMRDLTDTVRAAEDLRDAERRFRAVANLVPDLLWSSEPNGAKNWYNQRWVEYTGQSLQRAMGWGWLEAIHPEDREQYRQRFLEAVKTGEPLRHQYRIRHVDGEYRWFLGRAEPLRDERGRIMQWFGSATDIQDLLRAETAYAATQDRLRSLAENLPGGAAFIVDQELRYLLAGGEALTFAGSKSEDFIGRTVAEMAGPELAALYEPNYRRALSGENFTHEHQAHGRSFLTRGGPLRDANGAVIAAMAVSYDITERKRVEEALQANEEQFRSAIEDAPIPVIMHAEDGQVLQVSKTWTELTGYRREDMTSFDAWLNRAYGPGADRVRDQVRELFKGEARLLDAEIEILTRSGERRLWSFSASAPGRLRDGRRYIVGMAVDITDRKQVEQKLRESEERLRLIVENAREYAIVSMCRERLVISWNTGAERILGYEQAEILGKSADLIFTEEDRAAGAPEQEARVALTKGRAADERWHVRKDGTRFWGSGVMTAMHDHRGAAIGFVKIFRDQTVELRAKESLEKSRQELWEAVQENEAARREAEAANQAKDHFLAVLSHELRTPLTPVLMVASTLMRRSDLPAGAAEALEMIRRNVQLEAQFIDELLDATRIGRGKLELANEPLDVHEALQHAISVSMPDIEARSQKLTVDLRATKHQLLGDFARLQQVFWNLLKNASKFSATEGEVRVTSRNVDDSIVIEVSDMGIGIPPEAMERIFDPFVQASETVTRQFGGLGLGLAVAKATVEGHGGKITAQSGGEGQGATFRVELPLTRTVGVGSSDAQGKS